MEPPAAPPDAPVRVLVVARQPLARAGLRGLLADRADVTVVGQATSSDEAGRQLAAARPDAVVAAWEADGPDAGLGLPELAGQAGTPVVLVGDAPDGRELGALVRAGIRGFLLPDATAEDIAAALRAATQGLLVLAPSLGRGLAASGGAPPEADPGEALTEREREVLQFMALGLPNKSIATRLRISEHTVKFHVGSILGKLDAASRTEAVTRAARRGLLAL